MSDKNTNKQSIKSETFLSDIAEQGKDFSKKLPILGHAVWLYMQSPPHKYYFIQDIESRILAPIALEQSKLYIKTKTTGLPMAFVSWAYLSEEVEERYCQSFRLAPSDWKSGNNLWLIDVLAPFGGSKKIYQELFHSMFKDKVIHLLFPSKQGGFKKTTVKELIESANIPDPDTTKH